MLHLTADKKLCLRWCAWFCIGNILLFWAIGLNYLSTIPWLDSEYLTFQSKGLFTIFLISSYLSHFALFALLLYFIILSLLFIIPARSITFIFAIVLATSIAGWLLIDTFVYGFYRFHLNGIVLNFAIQSLKNSIFDLSTFEILIGIIIFCMLLLIEWIYATWLWRKLNNPVFVRRWFQWIAISLSFCLYLSYSIIFFSANSPINRVFIEGTRFLPLYNELLGCLLPSKNGSMILERATENYTVQPAKSNQPLKYPLHPLQFSITKQPLNLLIIAIDTWRFDMLNQEITPHIHQFAKNAWIFTHHLSGGNSTGPGFFSLFYGMPATYWTAMEMQHRGPILLDTLIKNQYQTGIFSSAQLTTPPLDRTVFQAIPHLDVNQQPGINWRERDQAVTEKFKQFILHSHPDQPFFSFLVYKAAHAYCFEEESIGPFQPVVKKCNRLHLNQNNFLSYINRYKNALYQIDQQVKQVIDLLETHDLLKNTIVIITADHGEEFDDNHLGYWGHASNFTRYQIQVPLIIHWPGEAPHVFTHLTSHYDIVPTLISRMLGASSPLSDYSVGKLLPDASTRPYLVLSSYIHLGIIEADRITTIFPSGHGEVTQLNGQKNSKMPIHNTLLAQALQELRHFYKD